MEIDKSVVEAVLVLLFKLEEFKACEAMLEVYKKYFVEDGSATLH